jgi:hypothetical protein
MDRVQGGIRRLDVELENISERDPTAGTLFWANFHSCAGVLNQLQAQTNVPRVYIALGAGLLVFVFLFFGFGASFFSHLIGFLYPAYASFRAIESKGTADDTQW